MGGWGVFLGLRIFFLKIFHPKIKSVQKGLKCKKTHKKIFSSEQLLPQTRPESNSPGLKYLDTLGPGPSIFWPGPILQDSKESCVLQVGVFWMFEFE